MSGIGRASALLASGTVVSRLLGFVRVFVLAIAIGNVGSTVGDAYQSATLVPSSIYALIGGGLLSAILVPQIVRASTAADRGQAYVNRIVTIAVIAFAAVALAATLLAPVLMPLYVPPPGPGQPDGRPLAIAFAYWSLPQVFFLAMYAVLGEVLNARGRFGAYTWAPVANNVVSIATLVAFLVVFGTVPVHRVVPLPPGEGALLAGGTTLGLLVQALVLALVWRRAGLAYRPDFRWRGVGLRATGQAAGWTFAMLVLTQAAGFLQTRVASGPSGADSPSNLALQNAWLLFMLPHSIITVSLATAFYPRMSEHAAEGDTAALRDDASTVLRIVLLVIAGATAALLAAALPVTAFFSSTAAQAHAAAPVLIAYLLGLLPFTVLFVVQRCFYALADTRTPFRFTVAQLLVVVPGILLCLLLPDRWTATGIAAAISVGAVVQLIVATVLLRRRLGPLMDPHLTATVRRCLLAGLPALAVGIGALALVGGFSDGLATASRLGGLVGALVVAAAALLVYVGVLALLRAPELGLVTGLVRSRLRR